MSRQVRASWTKLTVAIQDLDSRSTALRHLRNWISWLYWQVAADVAAVAV